MATPVHPCGQGVLIRYEAELEPEVLPERVIHLTPQFQKWLEHALPKERRDRGRQLSPIEQVEEIFRHFILGRPMGYDVHRKLLDPVGLGVWEIKTVDVRMLGWFPCHRTFIAAVGVMKRMLPRRRDYRPHIDAVVAIRNGLDLDEPKFLTGVRVDDIL